MKKKCRHCSSEFVYWNWVKFPFWGSWFRNFFYNSSFPYFRWKFWKLFDRWLHECWDCSGTQSTFFKVKNGLNHEDLKKNFVYLPKHQLQDDIQELWWIQDQGKHFSEKERLKFDQRVFGVLASIKETLENQWKLDHSSVTATDLHNSHFTKQKVLLPQKFIDAITKD